MSKYRESVLTDGGLNLARQAENARIKIAFTRAVLSAEDHTSDSMQALEKLTSLNAFVQAEQINYTNILNTTDVSVPLRFSNANQTTNNYINTIGLYATDGTTEVLHSVIVNDDPELFPVYNGSTPQYVKINFETEVGRTSQINANVSPMGLVTEEELSAATQGFEASSSHNADVSSLSAEIGSVSSAIANNSGIASEFSSVSSVVANNSSAITLLQSSVSNNSSAIGSLQTSVNSNSSNISTLQSSVVSNSNNIGTLQNSVSNNANSITNLSNNKVQDNHDGTVTVNGNVYAITKTLTSAVDFNTLTVPGTYLCPLGIGSYSHSPLAGTGTTASIILQVTNDNAGDIFQTAFAPTIYTPITRQYSFASWSAWLKIASNTDVVNLQNAVNGVLARQHNLIQNMLNNSMWSYFIESGTGNVDTTYNITYNLSTNIITFNSSTSNYSGNIKSWYINVSAIATYAQALGYSSVNYAVVNGLSYNGLSLLGNYGTYIVLTGSNVNGMSISGLQLQVTFS